jgi:hypothetical protein
MHSQIGLENTADNEVRKAIDLLKAGAEHVEVEYFRLVTTYERRGIVRERVFCYELYHQIRLLMAKDYTLSLHGEIDKSGHGDFNPDDQKNPDFVLHVPGTHEGNTLVIEVKGTLEYAPSRYLEDFKTLVAFVTKYGYKAGAFLLYNHEVGELVHKLARIERTNMAAWENVYILSIRGAGGPCTETTLRAICA